MTSKSHKHGKRIEVQKMRKKLKKHGRRLVSTSGSSSESYDSNRGRPRTRKSSHKRKIIHYSSSEDEDLHHKKTRRGRSRRSMRKRSDSIKRKRGSPIKHKRKVRKRSSRSSSLSRYSRRSCSTCRSCSSSSSESDRERYKRSGRNSSRIKSHSKYQMKKNGEILKRASDENDKYYDRYRPHRCSSCSGGTEDEERVAHHKKPVWSATLSKKEKIGERENEDKMAIQLDDRCPSYTDDETDRRGRSVLSSIIERCEPVEKESAGSLNIVQSSSSKKVDESSIHDSGVERYSAKDLDIIRESSKISSSNGSNGGGSPSHRVQSRISRKEENVETTVDFDKPDTEALEALLRHKALENLQRFRDRPGGKALNINGKGPEGRAFGAMATRNDENTYGKPSETPDKKLAAQEVENENISSESAKEASFSAFSRITTEHPNQDVSITNPGHFATATSINGSSSSALTGIAEGALNATNETQKIATHMPSAYEPSEQELSQKIMSTPCQRVTEVVPGPSEKGANEVKPAPKEKIVTEVRPSPTENGEMELGTIRADASSSDASCRHDPAMNKTELDNSKGRTIDSSQFEQKTMSVMRGGEMVQVSYKVYIPKRPSALARRQLQR
ncbi:hypothetical protein AMTRI_Chr02g215330 [Amborella trichopoda]|uniref:R3H domain-containing protein n=1 Tax=Amborella trichopoda TaxID=13333 RepID=U5D3A2_AMBTC|nr:uncharacterized protein LOC18445044 [Amborella trichopoda]ERN16720.1 hypothetical protein AMTR_s00183p00036690 [Amborella trichopoda]|eukprot:XP_006855253.1 uncharacterized protein LOC18445044 [Amborella trichopoda]